MLLSQQMRAALEKTAEHGGLLLRCPHCRGSMGSVPDDGRTVLCPYCDLTLSRERGVWRALSPERAMHFSRFVEDYQLIRAAEGRGSTEDDYYLALPDRDLSGRNSAQWAIRASTFHSIERKILRRIAHRAPLRILDLGAGNGWMSYRLALQGHEPIAVDLMANDQDGLEAAEHYRKYLPQLFQRFQAEIDNLPFDDGQFDVVIFNASFHYSENYEKTLGEALRCTSKGGTVIIADTPWYGDERSGARMLEERRAFFIKTYGFPSDGLNSLEYLTDLRLGRIANYFGIRWQIHQPYYGMRWHLRPWVARLRRKRTPSRFRIYTTRVPE